MIEIISKELLSEVFGKKIIEISISDREARERGYSCVNGVFIIFEDNRDVMINIYELAHKCKEWAFNSGYVIKSCKSSVEDSIMWVASKFIDTSYLGIEKSETEPEAIFKACEWILDNKTT